MSLADVRIRRTLPRDRPGGPSAQETAALAAAWEGHPPSTGPNPLLPVVQLWARDVPLLPRPEGADLLQVLWCPLNHLPEWMPTAHLVWRSSAESGQLLTDPPEPVDVAYYGAYVPNPCVLHPEVVTEYPSPFELDAALADRIEDWCEQQVTGAHPTYRQRANLRAYYQYELSVAPGWKVGGWSQWGLRDYTATTCRTCGSVMNPLLTIDSSDSGGTTWRAVEDRDDRGWIGVTIGRGDTMQLYYCPTSFDHPHREAMQ
ncbi:hypothetical protein [Kitasatospora cineracea]|uniref:hypothetical protein n=1 Tax=Kitasatospora cineracea TaxID=88074 RepID=UPI0036910C55